MPVFLDTSGFYAFASADDQYHLPVREVFRELARRREKLFTSSYVVAETMGLLQHRLGCETLARFVAAVLPLVEIVWIGPREHQAGWQLMQGSPARHFTIVDATGMIVMRQEGLRTCVATDQEFARQGFEVLPRPGAFT